MENKKYVLKFWKDSDVESPRTSFDNAGTMVCWHRRYDLGDSHSYDSPEDFLMDLASSIDEKTTNEVHEEFYETDKLSENEFLSELINIIDEEVYILPLYLYDHSGLTMNTVGYSCPWDSGQVGFIYMTKETAMKEGINNPKEYLVGEVEVYDQYLRGDIYGYQIVEIKVYDDGFERELDVVDSCWGFYGDDIKENGMLEHIDLKTYGLTIDSTNIYDYKLNYSA